AVSLSTATAKVSLFLAIGSLIRSKFFSASNSGVWTPITRARRGRSFPADCPPPPEGSGNELSQPAIAPRLRPQEFVSAPGVPPETNFPGGRCRRRHGSVLYSKTAWRRQAVGRGRPMALGGTPGQHGHVGGAPCPRCPSSRGSSR